MGDLIIFWSLYSSFYTLLSSPDWWEVGESKCREYHPLIISTIASYKMGVPHPTPSTRLTTLTAPTFIHRRVGTWFGIIDALNIVCV